MSSQMSTYVTIGHKNMSINFECTEKLQAVSHP